MERILIRDLKNLVGQEALVKGWVDVRRDHGKLIFIDLRDMSGKVQTVIIPKTLENGEEIKEIRSEWVLEIECLVKERPENLVNKEEELGAIEIEAKKVIVINRAETPLFDLSTDGREINEETRLKYRYLDLRRARMQKNLRMRHKIFKFIRDYLSGKDFIEIETPLLTKSSPEGARDFIVPSRLHNGQFYALPQSPQQYKQLLMASCVEKYFQMARCLRDEDTRGDRQAEFTQLDIEMSFPKQEDILNLIEGMYTELVETLYPEKVITQKPWPRMTYRESMDKFNDDRPDLRKDKNNPNELAFCWVLDFPLFEEEKKGSHFAPSHHMFTAPKEEDLAKLDTDPASVKSYQHDLSLNGFEIAGGSIRIHDPKIQEKVFDLIGFSQEQKDYFNHMLTAFTFGIPPHGGIASGMDRFVALLQGEPNIREVMAFPKTGDGRDLMMGAPSEIFKEQLDEAGIEIKKKK